MPSSPDSAFVEAFGGAFAVETAAPGRIEFIGNHTDYNGGLVMGAAIDRHVRVGIAPRDDERIEFFSTTAPRRVTVPLYEFSPYKGADSWVNYPLGVLSVLRTHGLETPHGFNLAVDSSLPSGAGLSSSAALELASGFALCALYGLVLDRATMAKVGRRAENEFVGVPCGILDQGTSAFGAADHLVRIDCAHLAFSTVAIPEGTGFWIFDTHEKHSLVDSLYAERHRECMAARDTLRNVWPDLEHLAAVEPVAFADVAERLEEPVRSRARHVIEENDRVRQMEAALAAGDQELAGKLLFASHESSRRLFGNSTDALDYLVGQLAETPGVIGARLTGGGFGGAVMAWSTDAFTPAAADDIAARYAAHFKVAAPRHLRVQTGPGVRVIG